MDKIVPREVHVEEPDLQYEYFRAIKTLCIIMIILCIGIILKKNYSEMIENSRYMRFYPAETLYYQDYKDIKDYDKRPKLNNDYESASYGIFKDEHGKEKFLIVAKNPKAENTAIIQKRTYSTYTNNGYTFISNSEDELKNLQKRIETKNFAFIRNKNLKRILKGLDEDRDFTILVKDAKYSGLMMNEEANEVFGKVFNIAVIQGYKKDDGIEFSGEIAFENKLANIAASIKNIREKFSRKSIKIQKIKNDDTVLVVGVKDFDLWLKTFIKLTKSLPNNQYNATLSLIQTTFNSDLEEDIIKKLDGSAVFYLYKERRILHPMLILETKKDLASQAQKYLNFLQLTNISELSEKEVDNKTFNVLSSGFYPHNLSFGAIDENMFVLGHQNIIEKFVNAKEIQTATKNADFYLYSDIKKTPILANNRGFWNGYKKLELQLSLLTNIKFEGKLSK